MDPHRSHLAHRLHPDGTADAAGEEYVYQDGTYTERIDYRWFPALPGRTLIFDNRLEGDLWYHSGAFSVGDQELRINEV